MRKFGLAVMIAGSLAAITGCGSSNSKLSYSAFSNAADTICTGVNSQAAAIGEATSTANAANADKVDKIDAAGSKALSKLKALSGPSGLEAARNTFVADVTAQLAVSKTVSSAARSGDQAGYIAAATKLASGSQQTDADGAKMGAPACAKN